VADRATVDPASVVVRGGDMDDEKLQRNAEEHHGHPRTKGEWALSVATIAGANEAEVVASAGSIRQRVYRVSTAGVLADAGFAVVSDRSPHGLILLDGWPDGGTCERLRVLFSGDHVNPHYEERRRRGKQR
jgi:hypothetical protein